MVTIGLQLNGDTMDLNIKVITKWDDEDTPCLQKIVCEDAPEVRYRVYNLNDCPEDATINRDLFDAYQYLEAVQLGMNLAAEGFTNINVEDIEWEKD